MELWNIAEQIMLALVTGDKFSRDFDFPIFYNFAKFHSLGKNTY